MGEQRTSYQRGYFLGAFTFAAGHEFYMAYKSEHPLGLTLFMLVICLIVIWGITFLASSFIEDPIEC